MLITEITRRNIIDELKVQGIVWHGKLQELDFLNRLYNFKELPSMDPRYKDMESDFRQHRINNYDWDDDWVYSDDRLGLMHGDDSVFLKFLCELINPVVRSDIKEVQNLLNTFNEHIKCDGFRIVAEKYISKKPIFTFIKIDESSVKVENIKKIKSEFIKEQLDKCEKKLNENDYDGAITNARSLLEDVLLKDIYKQITGSEMKSKGDLIKDYKQIKKLLNLSEEDKTNIAFKSVTSGLTSIVSGLATIRNKMGDSHSREVKPKRHHAKLVVNASKTVIDFLYDVLDYQKERIEKLRTELFKLPYIRYGEKECYYGKCYSLKDRKIIIGLEENNKFLKKCDNFTKRMLLNELIQNYYISCWDDADRFFISVTILFDVVIEEDIQEIFEKIKREDQAHSNFIQFVIDLKTVNPKFISKDILKYINICKQIQQTQQKKIFRSR